MAGGQGAPHTIQEQGTMNYWYGFSLINFKGLPHHTAQGTRARGCWLVELLTATRKD